MMCLLSLHSSSLAWLGKSHLRKCVLLIVILFATSLVHCEDSQLNPTSEDTKVDSNSEKLAHLKFLTKIAFQKNFNLDRVNNITATNLTKEDVFQEAFYKLLLSLPGLKVAPAPEQSNGFCDHLPTDSAGINLKKFCNEALVTQCLTTKHLVNVLPKPVGSFPEALSYVCPFLLIQSHDQVCQKEIQEPPKKTSNKPSSSAVWGFGFLFVTIVSCCSLVGVGLLPFLSKSFYHMVLVLFEGLAVGSLASSALFHLIPQAFNLLGQDAQHNYLWKALVIFGGIYLFFLSERTMKIFIQRKEKKKQKRDQIRRNGNHLSLNISPSASAVSTTTIENGVLTENQKDVAAETYIPAVNEHAHNNHSTGNHHHHHH